MDNKLQWKAKHTNDFSDEQDFLETILLDNGVKQEDIAGFLHPTKKYLNDPLLMKNMDKAVELVHKHVRCGSKIYVKADVDVDGYTSSSTLIQFLQILNPNLEIIYETNYEKQHGLTYKDISKFTKDEIGLFIVLDASMTVENAKLITKNFSGDILVLDHHLIEEEDNDCYTNYCIAVNCTDGQYPNPHLSGVGVVQKFVEAYMDKYEEEDNILEETREQFYDLVSLGLVADSMDLRSLENRYYVLEGMKPYRCNNEFLNELVARKEEDMKYGRYIISMGWYVAPLINGCIRYGKPEEQVDTLKAMLGVNETKEYQPRRKHKDDPKPEVEIQTLQKYQARICENVKSRQDTEVRKFCKTLKEEITNNHLDKNSVIFIDGTKILERGTVSGLVANRLTSEYLRPVVLMRSKNALEYGGSGRNYSQGSIENLSEFLSKAGVHTAGHASAFGVNFKKSELDNIIAKCNEMLPPEQLCTIHSVDWEIPARKLKREHVQQVAENYDVFGSTVPEPLFAITDLDINASMIQAYGENANFIRFTYNGITFVKKYCQHDDFARMTCGGRGILGVNKKDLRLNIIGQFVLNTFEGKNYPEVKILAFDSEEVAKEKNTDWDDVDEEVMIKKNIVSDDVLDDIDW